MIPSTMSASPPFPRALAVARGQGGDAPPTGWRRALAQPHFEQPESPRRRVAWLVIALVAAVLVAALALAVGTGGVQERDMQWLVGLHDRLAGAGLIHTADEVADFVTRAFGPGPHLIPLTALVAFWAVRAGRMRVALLVPLAFGVGALGETLLKSAVARTRPNLYPDMATVTGPSVPSGHAVGAICAVALPLLVAAWLTRRRWLRITLVVSALVAVLAVDLSRLILAVHWPTDVLAGNLFGLAICGALAAALGVPLPVPGSGGAALLSWRPGRGGGPAAGFALDRSRRVIALAGAVMVAVVALVVGILLFGPAPD
jgi:undecaprenyl-diphosphatase